MKKSPDAMKYRKLTRGKFRKGDQVHLNFALNGRRWQPIGKHVIGDSVQFWIKHRDLPFRRLIS